jgi:hypothetical protein
VGVLGYAVEDAAAVGAGAFDQERDSGNLQRWWSVVVMRVACCVGVNRR